MGILKAIAAFLQVLTLVLQECIPLIREWVREKQARRISDVYNAHMARIVEATKSGDGVAVDAAFAALDEQLLSSGFPGAADAIGGRGDGSGGDAQSGRVVHGDAGLDSAKVANPGSATGGSDKVEPGTGDVSEELKW